MPDRYEVRSEAKSSGVISYVIDTQATLQRLTAAVLAQRLNAAEVIGSRQDKIINKLNFALDRVDGKMIAAQVIAREAQKSTDK